MIKLGQFEKYISKCFSLQGNQKCPFVFFFRLEKFDVVKTKDSELILTNRITRRCLILIGAFPPVSFLLLQILL